MRVVIMSEVMSECTDGMRDQEEICDEEVVVRGQRIVQLGGARKSIQCRRHGKSLDKRLDNINDNEPDGRYAQRHDKKSQGGRLNKEKVRV